MVQALLAVMPPTATDVNVDDGYTSSDPFATIANAADAAMVEVLTEDMGAVEFDDDELPTQDDWAAYYAELLS